MNRDAMFVHSWSSRWSAGHAFNIKSKLVVGWLIIICCLWITKHVLPLCLASFANTHKLHAHTWTRAYNCTYTHMEATPTEQTRSNSENIVNIWSPNSKIRNTFKRNSFGPSSMHERDQFMAASTSPASFSISCHSVIHSPCDHSSIVKLFVTVCSSEICCNFNKHQSTRNCFFLPFKTGELFYPSLQHLKYPMFEKRETLTSC